MLLDGPKKAEQLENLKTIIRHVGRAGIPIIGYNFSIAGVAGRVKGPFARGGAEAVGMDGPCDTPMPNGMVWNMVYDRTPRPAPCRRRRPSNSGSDCRTSWTRSFPWPKRPGVTLAAHPDDPPLPTVRGQPRLVYQPQLYQKLLDLKPSPRNALEFCLGTMAEMTEGDVYEAVDTYSRQGKLAYVHFRNVRGKVPHYRETFIDEGDVDMLRVLRILQAERLRRRADPRPRPADGLRRPWHAGMAYALGYLQAAPRPAVEGG